MTLAAHAFLSVEKSTEKDTPFLSSHSLGVNAPPYRQSCGAIFGVGNVSGNAPMPPATWPGKRLARITLRAAVAWAIVAKIGDPARLLHQDLNPRGP